MVLVVAYPQEILLGPSPGIQSSVGAPVLYAEGNLPLHLPRSCVPGGQ